MITKTISISDPPRAWKLFAIFMIVMVGIGDVPKLAQPAPLGLKDAIRIIMEMIAMVGLVGYGWHRRIFPEMFWRVFVPTFCLITVAQAAFAVPTMVRFIIYLNGSMMIMVGMAIAWGPPLAMAAYTCLGLLRYAHLTGPDRRPLGVTAEPPRQLALHFD